MIKQKDLKFKNNLFYYKDKLFTGQAIDNKNKWWYKEGKAHRDNDLPAVEYSNGNKWWCKEGKRHRDNGPAVERSNGDKLWFYNGKTINCKNNEEYSKIIKLLVFK